MSARPLLRRLAPLLVLVAIAGAVAWRTLRHPQREVALQRLDDPTLPDDEVQAVLDRYPDDEDVRWAAARAFLRHAAVERAIRAVWPPGGPGPEYGPRLVRFGDTGLRAVGWADGDRFEAPTALAYMSLTVLLDGGAAGAREELARLVRTESKPAISFYNRAIDRRGGRGARRALIDAMRPLDDLQYRIAVASLAMDRVPYAERDGDLKVLLDALDGDLRATEPPRWASACLALGRSEASEAKQALAAVARRLAGSPGTFDREGGAVAACGLIAAGDWSAEAQVLPFVLPPNPSPLVVPWYAEAVLVRHRRGEPAGLERAKAIARGLPNLRGEIGWALLLGDDPPGPEVGADAIAEEMADPHAPPLDQVVGFSYGIRRGSKPALDRLTALLAQARGLGIEPGAAHPQPYNPLVLGLRALYLYGAR